MVIVAVLSLNAFHPGLCFREGYDIKPTARKMSRRQAKKAEAEAEKEAEAEAEAEAGRGGNAAS